MFIYVCIIKQEVFFLCDLHIVTLSADLRLHEMIYNSLWVLAERSRENSGRVVVALPFSYRFWWSALRARPEAL